MPSGSDSLPETDLFAAESDNWGIAVTSALRDNNSEALGELYRSRVRAVGQENATQEWLEIVSGWDASATTG